ncbi:hypothetical protein CEUSTIGMA_g6196.t1 [Chlamydomonas eustigma]|uniref:Uncharacterized protein n=1 Tax=Chlamydomonas eustigma TaxID=1157962 RepID=A0A250X767_9CHLO|nr:hypothetical protein CEUSTIGMA_g6196.t1 [Chlamydomonas eustigma]|eukprot:GAX78759.1 hypothetical protein CEUSTIGMA_g6196.t1 [Chlamydomonas eustigma]
MSKRGREFVPSFENHVKNPHLDFRYVNPFELMMAAAKTKNFDLAETSKRSSGAHIHVACHATASLAPCAHCGRHQNLQLLQQCESCQDVYCSMCSTLNYEERDVRTFCLECNAQVTSSMSNQRLGADRHGSTLPPLGGLLNPSPQSFRLLGAIQDARSPFFSQEVASPFQSKFSDRGSLQNCYNLGTSYSQPSSYGQALQGI